MLCRDGKPSSKWLYAAPVRDARVPRFLTRAMPFKLLGNRVLYCQYWGFTSTRLLSARLEFAQAQLEEEHAPELDDEDARLLVEHLGKALLDGRSGRPLGELV